MDCRRYYKSFFLNWNPQLFSYQSSLHDHWPANVGPLCDTYYVGANPQYTLVVDSVLQSSKGKANTAAATGAAAAITTV